MSQPIQTAKLHSFEPIADTRSRVLLLGTMPGAVSLRLNQYYGHNGNQFWRLIFDVFGKPLPSDYSERKAFLLEKGIAVWDVLQSCEREGSGDNKIKNDTPNDFDSLFTSYPNIKTVLFTSIKAKSLYESNCKTVINVNYHILPSPSRANTWKNYDEKLRLWKSILGHLA